MNEQLKQRVAGAAVLLTIAVVFVPMVLRGPPPGPDRDASAPVVLNPPVSTGTAEGFRSRIVAVERGGGDRAAERPGTPARAAVEPSGESARSEPRDPPAPPVGRERAPAAGGSPSRVAPPRVPPPRVPPAPVAPAPVAPAAGWAVQLGVFSEPGNAIALRERLRSAGHAAFVESVTQGGQKMTRVLVGPASSKERAALLLERLRSSTSLRGMLVRYPPP